MTGATPIVRLSGLRLDRGGRTILDGIDLEVPRGSIVAVLGPSGSGKSTLLSALTGELQPAAGSVEVLGAPLPADKRALLERRQSIGVPARSEPDHLETVGMAVHHGESALADRAGRAENGDSLHRFQERTRPAPAGAA